MVSVVFCVLAIGAGGPGVVPHRLVARAAVPHCRHCRGRNAGTGKGDHIPAGTGTWRAPASSAVLKKSRQLRFLIFLKRLVLTVVFVVAKGTEQRPWREK